MRVDFHPLARAELRQRDPVHAVRARGLARSLRDEVQAVLDLLAEALLAGQEQRTGVRDIPICRSLSTGCVVTSTIFLLPFGSPRGNSFHPRN